MRRSISQEANHLQRHVARGRIVGKCPLCRADPRFRSPERLIALNGKEVAALRQFVERVETLTRFVRDLLGER